MNWELISMLPLGIISLIGVPFIRLELYAVGITFLTIGIIGLFLQLAGFIIIRL